MRDSPHPITRAVETPHLPHGPSPPSCPPDAPVAVATRQRQPRRSLVPTPDLIVVEESTLAGGEVVIASDDLMTSPAEVDLTVPQLLGSLEDGFRWPCEELPGSFLSRDAGSAEPLTRRGLCYTPPSSRWPCCLPDHRTSNVRAVHFGQFLVVLARCRRVSNSARAAAASQGTWHGTSPAPPSRPRRPSPPRLPCGRPPTRTRCWGGTPGHPTTPSRLAAGHGPALAAEDEEADFTARHVVPVLDAWDAAAITLEIAPWAVYHILAGCKGGIEKRES